MTTITSSQPKNKLPNGPKIPAFVQTFLALIDQYGLLETYHKRYGDIYFTPASFGFPPFAVFGEPQASEQIFTADPNCFEVGKQTNIPIKVLLGDNSLVLLDGEKHKKERKLLMPPFHGERMKSYAQIIIDTTEQVIGQWQINKPITIRDYTQEISLRVIIKAVFGLNEGERYERIRQLVISWLEAFNSTFKSAFLLFPLLQKDLGWLTPWGQFVREKRLIHQILDEEINERRNNPELLGEDILSLMLSAQDEEGNSMTNAELRDELITMLFAGHETTANSLAWAFYWIHYHPEIKQKLIAELNTLNRDADPNTIAKLPYLSAVVSETLRIHPVVIFTGRQLKQPMEIMGYEFESGTFLILSIYWTHRRKDIYPEPEKFKPERFIEKQFSPYEFIPFGGGHRRCLGYAFALFEMKLVLATILSKVELELLDKHPLKSARRGIFFTPSGGVKMALKSSR